MTPTEITDFFVENNEITKGIALASVSNDPKNHIMYEANKISKFTNRRTNETKKERD